MIVRILIVGILKPSLTLMMMTMVAVNIHDLDNNDDSKDVDDDDIGNDDDDDDDDNDDNLVDEQVLA